MRKDVTIRGADGRCRTVPVELTVGGDEPGPELHGDHPAEDVPVMRVRGILPYFGGKRRLAGEVVRELGDHLAFWDCCHGGLSVLLAKRPAPHETVIDLNGHASNLAMVLASPRWAELHDRLGRTLAAESLFREAQRRFKGERRPAPDCPDAVGAAEVERAYWYFLVSWMGMQGVAGTARSNYQFAVRYKADCHGNGASKFRGAVESVPWWHRRLFGVQILSRSMFAVLPSIEDAPGVVIYADPPYFLDTRGTGGGSRYEHDFTLRDHVRLARELGRFRRARVVVSYYDHPYLARLYPGWTVRRLPSRKTVMVQGGKGRAARETPEVLLINGPSYADRTLFCEP